MKRLGLVVLLVMIFAQAAPLPPAVERLLPGRMRVARADSSPTTVRASVSSTGGQPNGNSNRPSISDDGRYVAFDSTASNLVSGDTNFVRDVFVRDLRLGATERVSVSSSGVQGNGTSEDPHISGDGRFVVFESTATNLVAGDTQGWRDIFIRDRATGVTERISVSSSGAAANNNCFDPAVSFDGRYVVFTSLASNLASPETYNNNDVFIRDRQLSATSTVSIDFNGQPSNGTSWLPTIASSGYLAAFSSSASDLVPNDTNITVDIFVASGGGSMSLASIPNAGGQSNGGSDAAAISVEGRHVSFASTATNLVAGDTNAKRDVFVRDRVAATTKRVSVSSSGEQATVDASAWSAISARGRYVVFASTATNLVPNDTNGFADTFLRDVEAGTTERVSVSTSGAQGNNTVGTEELAISGNGRFVAFMSVASNLVAGDSGSADIFVRDRGPTVPLERTFGNYSLHSVNPTWSWADPINTATGSFSHAETDIALPGIGIPFVFTRTYNSADTATSNLGTAWTHSLAPSLTIEWDGDVLARGENGQQTFFAKQADGSFDAGPGGLSTLTAVAGAYDLVRTDQVRYHFDSSGRLTQIRDRNDQGLTLSYDGNGRLQQVTDSAGRTIGVTHDLSSGLLTGISLPGGRSTSYAYTNGRLTSFTDPRGKTTTYAYDAEGRLTEITDPRGNKVVRNTYDINGRVVEQLDPIGNQSTMAWDSATQTTTMTDARAGEWKDVYDGNRLLKRTDPLGHETLFQWDDDLNLVAITDPRGNTTSMTYDSRGNLLTKTSPAPFSFQESFTYDAKNNRLSWTNFRGFTTTYDYDAAGNLIRETKPGSIVTEFGRDPAGTGLLSSVTDPRGKTTLFEHDTAGNPTAITSPLGFKTTMIYDTSGRLTGRVEPRGNETGTDPNDFTWSFAYDGGDNLLTQTDPLANTTTFTYDAAGNLATRTDAKNRTTTFAYNAANELTSVAAPDAATTAYEYDASGNRIKRTDAQNHVTSYAYDAANRLSSVTAPLGRVWSYEYDANGDLTKLVDASGNSTPDPNDGTTTYSFDELNRLTAINYSDSTPDVSLQYDANGNRTQMTDGVGTETYTYDSVDRLTGVSRGTDSFSYLYDPAGNITRRTYPDGTIVDNTFDNDGRIATVASAGQAVSYAYDAAGNLMQTTLPAGNGYVETRTYDRAGRLGEVRNVKSGSTLSFNTYTRDEVGNPTSIVTQDGTTTLEYDLQDRLTEACFLSGCTGVPDPFVRYTYDAVGNRLTEERAAGTTTYTYDDADQLLTATGPSGPVAYTYDLNGNQMSAGTRTFSYDLANRLSSTTNADTTVGYTYDGDGKRLGSQTTVLGLPSAEIDYLWDPNAAVPELALEEDGSGALLRRYVYGRDLASMTTGGASYHFHYDGIGSVVNLTDAAGDVKWSYAYEPFGATRSETPGVLAPENLIRFTGELRDSETNLYHLRARQYDPTTGRFLNLDPLPASVNDPYLSAYLYANDRPTVLVDPTGQRAIGGGSGFTAGVCLGLQVGIFSAHFGGTICFQTSSSGEIGLSASGGGGAGGGFSASILGQFTSGSCLDDLEGPFFGAGGSAGAGIVGTAEGFTGVGSRGQIVTGGSAGFGLGTSEVHAGGTATRVFGVRSPTCAERD